MSKTTEHIIKNNIDVNGYDGKDDEYFTGPTRLKIAYLQGYKGEEDPTEWLKSKGHVVLSTTIHTSVTSHGETELLLEMFEPDIIIGNSYSAWDMGSKLNVPTLLFKHIKEGKDIFKDIISLVSKLSNDK
tara:strand:+ start:161 stop:550 length:390 start_codon:yes stop_codon:yes gene_type:complete